jgi:hypothetical protein
LGGRIGVEVGGDTDDRCQLLVGGTKVEHRSGCDRGEIRSSNGKAAQ